MARTTKTTTFVPEIDKERFDIENYKRRKKCCNECTIMTSIATKGVVFRPNIDEEVEKGSCKMRRRICSTTMRSRNTTMESKVKQGVCDTVVETERRLITLAIMIRPMKHRCDGIDKRNKTRRCSDTAAETEQRILIPTGKLRHMAQRCDGIDKANKSRQVSAGAMTEIGIIRKMK